MLEQKELKILHKYNQIAKNNFKNYYLRYDGIGAATLRMHKGEDRLSYCTTVLPIYEVYNAIGLDPVNDLLLLDSFATFKATANPKHYVKSYLTTEDKLVVVTKDPKVIGKTSPWEFSEDGNIYITIGRIVRPENVNRVFSLIDLEVGPMTDISDLIPALLNKEPVELTNNSLPIIIGKPLLPNISTKATLSCYFQPVNEEEFKAYFCVEKEQVCNYHIYIAYPFTI